MAKKSKDKPEIAESEEQEPESSDEISEGSEEEADSESAKPQKDHPHSVEQAVEEEPESKSEASTANYQNYEVKPRPQHPFWNLLPKILLVVVILGLLAGGAYWFLKNHKSSPKQQSATSATTQSPAAATSSSKITEETKHYDSAHLGLGIDYPADWTVNDTGGGQMTIISPSIKLTASKGESDHKTFVADYKILLTVRDKTQKLTEFDKGDAVAALRSGKITYTKPTANQRTSTYESFLRYYPNMDSKSLDGIYITGTNDYREFQAVPAADFNSIEPIISITFVDSSSKPQPVALSTLDNRGITIPLLTMLKSLTIN